MTAWGLETRSDLHLIGVKDGDFKSLGFSLFCACGFPTNLVNGVGYWDGLGDGVILFCWRKGRLWVSQDNKCLRDLVSSDCRGVWKIA